MDGNKMMVHMQGVGQMINSQTHAFTGLNQKVDVVWELLRKMEKNEQ